MKKLARFILTVLVLLGGSPVLIIVLPIVAFFIWLTEDITYWTALKNLFGGDRLREWLTFS